MKNIAVIGFSVGAGGNNYVFEAQNALKGDGVRLHRITLGAQNPVGTSYLVEYLLDSVGADAAIFELSTSGYYSSGKKSDLRAALRWITYLCQQRGMPFRFLNLPRLVPDGEENWVQTVIGTFARYQGVGHHSLKPKAEELRDAVHVNAEGKRRYAAALTREIRRLLEDDPATVTLRKPPVVGRGFDPIDRLLDGIETRVSDRYGFACQALDLPVGQSVTLRAREGTRLRGIVIGTNPRAGVLQLRDVGNDKIWTKTALTTHSYYERMTILPLPRAVEALEVTQLPELPPITPAKGEPNTEPRLGCIMGVTYQTVAPHPEPLTARSLETQGPPSATTRAGAPQTD